ncbi:MAG: DHH family phosphoesterase [Patescibacteria group bacterium]|jgi:single-stranded-DNA-specific exonuclease
MQRLWQVKQKISEDFINKFPEFDSVILQLLFNRGIDNQKKIDEFFNPDYSKNLFDPFLLKDMDRAVERIFKALKNKERVGIFGDYDADGVTSSVLLTELFKKIGLAGQVYIPDRVSEGYGMNKKAIDWLAKKDIKLIVSCDCGVSNKEEIDYAKEKYGIDCVITDHHHVPIDFDKKYIVVDSKRKGDKYPYKELAGVGVVFKLAQALITRINFRIKANEFSNVKLENGWEKSLLDLVTIGTIADCSPIISENRTLVKYGLNIIKETERIGLQSLMQVACVDPKLINSDRIGFAIAPRINSAGRMDHASASYKLLITEDLEKAVWLSKKIDKTNSSRQSLTSKLVDEAKKKIGDVKDQKVLMASGGNGLWAL